MPGITSKVAYGAVAKPVNQVADSMNLGTQQKYLVLKTKKTIEYKGDSYKPAKKCYVLKTTDDASKATPLTDIASAVASTASKKIDLGSSKAVGLGHLIKKSAPDCAKAKKAVSLDSLDKMLAFYRAENQSLEGEVSAIETHNKQCDDKTKGWFYFITKFFSPAEARKDDTVVAKNKEKIAANNSNITALETIKDTVAKTYTDKKAPFTFKKTKEEAEKKMEDQVSIVKAQTEVVSKLEKERDQALAKIDPKKAADAKVKADIEAKVDVEKKKLIEEQGKLTSVKIDAKKKIKKYKNKQATLAQAALARPSGNSNALHNSIFNTNNLDNNIFNINNPNNILNVPNQNQNNVPNNNVPNNNVPNNNVPNNVFNPFQNNNVPNNNVPNNNVPNNNVPNNVFNPFQNNNVPNNNVPNNNVPNNVFNPFQNNNVPDPLVNQNPSLFVEDSEDEDRIIIAPDANWNALLTPNRTATGAAATRDPYAQPQPAFGGNIYNTK